MPIDPSTLSALLSNLRQILVAKYFFLGAYTTLLYDHIMTLPEEVSYLLPGYAALSDRWWATDSNSVEEEEDLP